MGSKKFKGKTCAYCAVPGSSETGDHVFARQFFVESDRANLPEVPACARCNNDKSASENYLLQLLPLGASHAGADNVRTNLMPKRAAHHGNKVLRQTLESPNSPVWLLDSEGQKHERIPVLVDAQKLKNWCGAIAQGLAYFHWGTALAAVDIDVIPLADTVETEILSLVTAKNTGCYIEQSVGRGAFEYIGFRESRNAAESVWLIRIYGRMPIGGDPTISPVCASSWGVFITPTLD
jgi:hypothetical protein